MQVRMSLENRTPKMVRVEVRLNWRHYGEITVDFDHNQAIRRVRMPPVPDRPGLYRISIHLSSPIDGNRYVYIGEGKSIANRIDAYRRAYGEGLKGTAPSLSRRLREALMEGRAATVDCATTGRIDITGAERSLSMEAVAERRFAEAAAVIAESAQDLDGQVLVLNDVLGEYRFLQG